MSSRSTAVAKLPRPRRKCSTSARGLLDRAQLVDGEAQAAALLAHAGGLAGGALLGEARGDLRLKLGDGAPGFRRPLPP